MLAKVSHYTVCQVYVLDRAQEMATVNDQLIIAEPLGEASNRGVRSHNAFVCMYIYRYPSQSIIDTLIDCTIGKMV